MFSCACELGNSYLYVMYPLLQCTALSSFLNLPTVPLSSYLFFLFFSTVLNCPFLYSSSSSSSLLHFILHFSTHLYCHFPYSSSLHSTLLPQQIQYKGKSTVNTRPTAKGLLSINPFSQMFGIQHLDRKPLKEFYVGK